ncbi:hypothetical protein M1M24_gp49 [Polaribacter phage Freya_1]|uniref:Uncharacterized protein n=2 Tax=Freyavirus TaxID=2948713 RepID=A0A8E4ZMA3_9CAUD|nr:hypothetical protein M1M23_gp36 [Polaribacter phage Danklef_1]YP_010356738.1 hypothetical protein M1M24_gp49 [Polaribacter phage Freya_1]QQV90594.1 hypothetical protein Danklef2_37 [Polaribacter phage Danklef_2]QQV90671.1 hypothetical protein Danklef3_38 [Polaribacter phage Danklef_3]QQV90747.1 hypothetical protein Danklef4_37 [Polaribacter phage Danklef_4]QQV90825.1 hypothetical protein Danklef5_38 [Polaribacter phage Danklef_5]QQV90986.1 hypothetical protein Freya2_49 [Polaribacter phage
MAIIIGRISEIKDVSVGVHAKNLLTIKNKDGVAFLEFRNKLKNVSDQFNIGDNVMVEHRYDGKVSKNSGIQFNNLPATSIQKL